MALNIRQMEINDIYGADEIARLAFNSPQSRVEELARFLSFQPGGWLLADLDGELAGMVGAVDYGPFASIGMMVVRPDLQRKGIGSELMRAILHWVDQRGCPRVILEATPAGEALYTRLGFFPVDVTLRYQYSGEENGSVFEELAGDHKAKWSLSLAEFDSGIFGADRGRILQRYFRDFPGRSFLTTSQKDELTGYVVCRDNHIGPWLALDDYSARRLLAEALRLKFTEAPAILIPACNDIGKNILEQNGFILTRSCTHMVLGGTLSPTRRKYVFGESSLALG